MRKVKQGNIWYWLCTRRVNGVKCNKGKFGIRKGTFFDHSKFCIQTIQRICQNLYIDYLFHNVNNSQLLAQKLTTLLSNFMPTVDKCALLGFGMKTTYQNLAVLGKQLKWMSRFLQVRQNSTEDVDLVRHGKMTKNGYSDLYNEIV